MYVKAIGIAGFFGSEALIIKYLNLTLIKFMTQLPEIYNSVQLTFPINSGIVVPIIGPQPLYTKFAVGSIPYRLLNEVQKYLVPLVRIRAIFLTGFRSSRTSSTKRSSLKKHFTLAIVSSTRFSLEEVWTDSLILLPDCPLLLTSSPLLNTDLSSELCLSCQNSSKTSLLSSTTSSTSALELNSPLLTLLKTSLLKQSDSAPISASFGLSSQSKLNISSWKL